MTRVRWLVLIGTFLLPLWLVSAQEVNWTGIVEAAKPAVVFIETDQGYGSGAIISPNGYILTAAHVIEGASWITVVVEDTREYRASVVQADYQMDVAVLKISASGLTWLKLGDSTQLHYEDEIRVLGYPLPAPAGEIGVGFVAVAGKVRGFRQRAYGILIQHDAPTEGGHSGGPMINARAEIVGVHVGFIAGKVEAYRVAVAINDARRIIPSRAIPSGPSPVQPPTRPSLPTGPIRVPGDYSSISAALQAAPEGAEIHVSRGTYRGDLLIARPVAITGEEGAVIQGNLTIQGAQNVTLNTVEIRGRVEIRNSTDVTISRVHVSGSPSIGIVIEDSTATISECQIEGSAGVGVDISFGGRVILRDCEIAGSGGDGVRVGFGAQARIVSTTIRDSSGDGLEITGGTVELLGNRFVDNRGYGIHAHSGATLLGERNRGQGNKLGLASEEVPIEVASIQVPQEMSLEEAIQEAGQTPILLAPGEYELGFDLSVQGELRILGRGESPADCTISSRYRRRIDVESGGRLVLVNLTLAGRGIVGDGEVKFLNSRVRRVEIVDRAKAEFHNCVLSSLSVGEEAQATIIDSEVSDSKTSGLTVWGSAQLSLADTRISGNGEYGLYVTGEAQVTLVNCTITANKSNGLELEGSAQASLVDCAVEANAGTGIVATDEARLTLRNCTVSTNESNGVSTDRTAQAILEGCTISGNGNDGLSVYSSAQATLTNSVLSGNRDSGLVVYEAGRASLAGCTLSNNEYGLWTGWNAKVALQNCTISANRKGIFVGASLSAQVEFRGVVTIHDNRGWGIYVEHQGAQVVGGPVTMRGNGVPLLGFVSASIRKPLVPQTQRTELSVPGDYPTIQEAIDAIAPGGTITLAEGTFREGFTIWKSVTIRGAGPDSTVLTAPSGVPAVVAILAEAQEVRVMDLRITEVVSDWYVDPVDILGWVELINVEVVGNVGGIQAYGAARLTLRGCEISGNRGRGLWLGDQAQLETIEDSWISDNWGCGIRMPEGGKLRGRNNWVKYNDQDFCNCSPPEGFLRESPPRPLREGEVEVCPTCEFTQFREAIRTAAPGATIRLGPGHYSGPVVIVKDLILIGAGDRTVVTGIGIGGNAVVELRDLTFAHPDGTGLVVGGKAQVNLVNCALSNNKYHGLAVTEEGRVTLQSCRIFGNGLDGLWVSWAAQVNVENSTITANERCGLWVKDEAQLNLKNCLIERNVCDGVRVMHETRTTVRDCVVRNNGKWGITAWLKNCEFDGGDGFWGEVILQDNEIYGNGRGDVCLPDLCLPEGACE